MRTFVLIVLVAVMLGCVGLYYLHHAGFKLIEIKNVGAEQIHVSLSTRGARFYEGDVAARNSNWAWFSTRAKTGVDIHCVGNTSHQTLNVSDIGYFESESFDVDRITLDACKRFVSLQELWLF